MPSEKIGSLYIPDVAKQQPLVGEIVLVGDKCGNEVNVGDRVLFGSRSWSRFETLGFPHMLLKYEDLMAVLSCEC